MISRKTSCTEENSHIINMSIINQKEYLKKYLGIGKPPGEKKKKKKKDKTVINKVKIIDDDADVITGTEMEEITNPSNEDAPQIVAVIDERPPSLRIDEKTSNKLWIPIGENEASNMSPPRQQLMRSRIKNESIDDDNSPPRHSRKKISPVREREENNVSPPRKRIQIIDDDYSPPRRSIKLEKDISPVRKKKKKDEDDYSPLRKRKDSYTNDQSPPRKIKIENIDSSPPRRTLTEERDMSPPRRKVRDNSSSPSRKNKDKSKYRESSNSSPPRRSKDHEKRIHRKSRWGSDEETNSDKSKMSKTLDGKKAGLQNANDLVKETLLLKKKEDEMFKNMSAELSGVNAETIIRSREVKDVEAEQIKLQKEKETKEKYSKWGKGLKQVDDQNEKIAQELYEMSKPLARYADDEDLEKYLKEQEREGDPMLAYIRKKKKKVAVEAGVPVKPEYQGEFMPNRFGIRPGYRWDGVDRSNGYEKRWFTIQNSKKASLEESYKWSTEDM